MSLEETTKSVKSNINHLHESQIFVMESLDVQSISLVNNGLNLSAITLFRPDSHEHHSSQCGS